MSEREVYRVDAGDKAGLGPSKWAKSGAGSYRTKHNKDWTKVWSFEELKSDPHAFFCTVCSHKVNSGHIGRSKVK